MRILTVSLALLCSFISLWGPADELLKQAPLLGVWVPKEKDSHVEIYKEGDKYFGKIIWLQGSDKGKLDVENPDQALKSKPLLDMVFLKNFEESEPNEEWKGGTVYDPHNGKTYSAKIYYRPKTDTLELRGYVGIPLLGRTETWVRLKTN